MKREIYKKIISNQHTNRKMLAVLLDPDTCDDEYLQQTLSILKAHTPDFVFVGGSHLHNSVDKLIELLKSELETDIILFPGNASQFSDKSDGLLYLSLLSGRNAEFLIGEHVNSAKAIKDSKLEVISTAYLLIEGGSTSSVEYMSNTRAIPHNKIDIAVSTAIAGELLGMQLTYLEAGSGAKHPVSQQMIQAVRTNTEKPLLVGGGIRTIEALTQAMDAGADLVVVGNVFETNPNLIMDFVKAVREYKMNPGPNPSPSPLTPAP